MKAPAAFGLLLLLSACAVTGTEAERAASSPAPSAAAAAPQPPMTKSLSRILPEDSKSFGKTTLPAVTVERRFLREPDEDARWPRHGAYLYLLFGQQSDGGKRRAAIRAYLCGFNEGKSHGRAASTKGAFIVPVRALSDEPEPRGDLAGLTEWTLRNYDFSASRKILNSLVLSKPGMENGARSDGIYFVISDGPLGGAYDYSAIYDVTRASETELVSFLLGRIQDLELGRAKTFRELETLSVSAGTVLASLGSRFGGMFFGVSEVHAAPPSNGCV